MKRKNCSKISSSKNSKNMIFKKRNRGNHINIRICGRVLHRKPLLKEFRTIEGTKVKK